MAIACTSAKGYTGVNISVIFYILRNYSHGSFSIATQRIVSVAMVGNSRKQQHIDA
ncbi:MAG: hypothetical protein LBS46_02180 [Dysgonamonadaceae bacterium]|nr:hypothetical protein [Dysgonamonadaceae bacterium]